MNDERRTGIGQDAPVANGRFHRILMPLISLTLFFVAIAAIHHLLKEVSYPQLVAELKALSWNQLLLALLFTASSFTALMGYDWSALAYIGRKLPFRTVALGSFCGYAISNTVGLSILSGGSVRYRFYLSAGLDAADIARVSLFSIVALGLGIHLVGAAALVIHPEFVDSLFRISPDALRWIGIAALVLLFGLVVFTFVRRARIKIGPWDLPIPSGPVTVVQLVVSVIDIVSAGACLYVLIDHPQVPFLAFLVVYAVALMIGVSSHVPGGLGVFESIMLLALHDSVSPENLAAAMLAYRVIYHLIPLLLALFVLVGRELAERASPIVGAVRYIHSWSSKLVPPLLAGLAFCNGIVLLVSTATPAVPERLTALKAFMPLVVVEISTISGSVIGLGLLLVARGLYRKLNGAYVITLLLCLAGSVFSLAKGIDYEEGVILLGTALVLFLCRREFYRRTVLMNSPFTAGWILSILGAVGATYWITLFSYKHVEYAHELWWQFEYNAEVSRSLRAGLGVTIVLFLVGINRLLKRPQRGPGLSSTVDLDKAEAIVRAQDDVDGNLALVGDKHLLFSDSGDAFIMYGVRGTSWIALGDPIGPAPVADELAWRFRELADREGGRIAFYQTSAETLPLYLDMGLVPLKYGEEALVSLETFSLQGAKRKGLRHAVNRGEHDGLSFEILPRETVPAHMQELAAVSASWLALKNAREKRFSLGAFDPNYVKRFAVAVARQGTRIVAFATVMSTDTKAEASIDLMRHTPEAPSSVMMFLFIKLILYFKAQGFRRFALGLAPLSGLETHPLAPVWHRFGHLIYNRGERFYNFRGLREFKDKFDPVWEPRYLATSGGINPLLVITDVATLIGGGISGVFKK